MRVRLPFATAAAWACLCGGVLGAARTRAAAHHLLLKNQGLLAAGVPPLPGAGHWSEMASWSPPAAGALFYGLSLGLGWGALLALWVLVARELSGRSAAGWTALAPSLWAAYQGDWALAALLALIGAGAAAVYTRSYPRGRSPWVFAACGLVIALGLVPWARSPEGAFTRLRDRVLFRTTAGLALNDVYYRWTLYPAEALKPLSARSQPAAAVELPRPLDLRFRSEAASTGLLCLPAGSRGADLTAGSDGSGGVVLAAADVRVPWPREPARREQVLGELSHGSDRARTLRKATALALYAGCPLALLWLLGSAASLAGSWASSRKRGALLSLSASVLLSVGLAVLATPDARLNEARRLAEVPAPRQSAVVELLRSSDPAVRYYGARAAARLGSAGEDLLLAALHDPVVNVRYTAAESLGHVGSTKARYELWSLLWSNGEWYVKERAYAALERLGWTPQRR